MIVRPSSVTEQVTFFAADALTFTPRCSLHLVTCVHGMHYLGDKLGFVEHAYQQLVPGGLFIGHMDTKNVRSVALPSLWPSLARRMRQQNIVFTLKGQVLCVSRTEAVLDFQMQYQGATLSDRPHSSGITVVDSWYATWEKVQNQFREAKSRA